MTGADVQASWSLPRLIYLKLAAVGLGVFAVAVLYCLMHGFETRPFVFDAEVTLRWAVPRWGAWPVLLPICFWLVWQAQRRGLLLVGVALAAVVAVAGVALFAGATYAWLDGSSSLYGVIYHILPMAMATYSLAVLAGFLWQRSVPAMPDEDCSSGPEQTQRRLAVNKGRLETSIATESIAWARAARNYVELAADGVSYIRRSSLSDLHRGLPQDCFLRVHRSYLVNRAQIEGLIGGRSRPQLKLRCGTLIPVGKSYRDSVLALVRESGSRRAG